MHDERRSLNALYSDNCLKLGVFGANVSNGCAATTAPGHLEMNWPNSRDIVTLADLAGFEAGGDGLDTGRHAATMVAGSDGVLHGMRTRVLQDQDGQTLSTHSISAGLDYPGVGPEHAWLAASGRASYRAITDAQAMEAFSVLCRTEGIIPALESAHALAGALQVGKELGPDALLLVNLSGRGDKDVATASKWFGHLSAEALDAAVSE